MNSTFRMSGMLISGVLLMILLAACGGAASTSTPAAATSAPAATVAEPTAAADTGAATAEPEAIGAAAEPTVAAIEAAPAMARLNLNEVTEEQLLSTIPDFSNRMVREFFEYRPYISIQQFRKEIGKYVSAEQVTAYEQYVYVPVDVNQADAETLQQLPGVDATIAADLIAARPYASNQAFLEKLAGLASAADAQQAAGYLAAQ